MYVTSNSIKGYHASATPCEVGGEGGVLVAPRPVDGRLACEQHFHNPAMPAQATVPNVSAASFQVARELLHANGLVAMVEGYQSDASARGTVLLQSPVATTSVDWVSEVGLILSDGAG